MMNYYRAFNVFLQLYYITAEIFVLNKRISWNYSSNEDKTLEVCCGVYWDLFVSHAHFVRALCYVFFHA